MLASAVFALLAAGAQAAPQLVISNDQQVFSIAALEEHLSSVPEGNVELLFLTTRVVNSCYFLHATIGFSIDLDAKRLVSFGEDERPVQITEREKVAV